MWESIWIIHSPVRGSSTSEIIGDLFLFSNQKLFRDHELSSEIVVGEGYIRETIIIRQTTIGQRQSISGLVPQSTCQMEKEIRKRVLHHAWQYNRSGNEFIFKTRSIVPAPDERAGMILFEVSGTRAAPF